VDAVSINGLYANGHREFRLSGGWSGGHDEGGLGSVGMMEGTRIVFTEPRVLEGMRAVNFVRVREEEPEMTKGLIRDKFELGKGVLVGDRSSEVSNEG
jgi:hypothetical protein